MNNEMGWGRTPILGVLVLVLFICLLLAVLGRLIFDDNIREAKDRYDEARALYGEDDYCKAAELAKEAVSRLRPIVFFSSSDRHPEYAMFVALLQAVNTKRFDQKPCGFIRVTLEQDVVDYFTEAKSLGGTTGLSSALCQISPNRPEDHEALSNILKDHGISYVRDDCFSRTPATPPIRETPEPTASSLRTPTLLTGAPSTMPIVSPTIWTTKTPVATVAPSLSPIPTDTTQSLPLEYLPSGECAVDENNIDAIRQISSTLAIEGTAATANPRIPDEAFDYFELWAKRSTDDSGSYSRVVQSKESKKDGELAVWNWATYGFKSGGSVTLRLWIYRKTGQHSDPGCIVKFTIP